MYDKENASFETIFRQNERRIHYHMHRLGIHDRQQEFYVEGIYAMWMAYKKHDPNKGPLATYFNYTIRNRLIDMLRKKTNDNRREQLAVQAITEATGRPSELGESATTDMDEAFWERIRATLSPNQWKWVQFYIIDGMTQKEIAEREGVTTEAVKSWAREARKKLRQDKEALIKLYNEGDKGT
ncbi:RNA polymerase sigma factor, sigma-70 family [Lentibacillus persicus]|uniref:RNA polymerase sigma factor, sigma-70 family n=2 Tax=Lentibacillus persicus TaxID=640948 RepID=A0A1I1VWS7_9BACI|nr:RNA polymerase sigma factor, sigma-70 family [Lentibacillus persicus]